MDDLELWRESAAAWIQVQGPTGDAARRFLDPYVWRTLGPVSGLQILDAGCGEGRFGRELIKAGAVVTGLEPTEAFAGCSGFPTSVGVAENLPFEDESFDVVLFYLVLIDIADYAAAISEATRVLRPGGRIVSVNLTPMATAANEPFWNFDEDGRKISRRVEFYGTPQSVVYEWSGLRIRNYHRPLQDYMAAYLAAGLRLERYEEPMDADAMPDSILAPNFDLMVWRKA